MNILSISSILPIPGIIKQNDFVLQTYKHYSNNFPGDKIVIIKPVKIDFNPSRNIKNETCLRKLSNKFSIDVNSFAVEIFPYLSAWRFRNLHALLTYSVYLLNSVRLKKLFINNDFNIIHAQFIFPDGLLAYLLHKRYKKPYVITTHNERFYFKHWVSRLIAKKILRNAFTILAINHTNYRYFRSIGINNIEILPLGFDKTFVREQKRTTNSVVSIFTVAELIKLKNIDKVIKALNTLSKKIQYHYTIIGSGAENESLHEMVTSLAMSDKVTFIKHLPYENIPDEMYKHDIFVMTSFFETFGRVYFEVMAMGIPVICAKESGISGLFKEMEEGISVNHNDVDEIAKAIEFLITNSEERHRIGRNGQKFVSSFIWENIVKTLNTKYSIAIDNSSSK